MNVTPSKVGTSAEKQKDRKKVEATTTKSNEARNSLSIRHGFSWERNKKRLISMKLIAAVPFVLILCQIFLSAIYKTQSNGYIDPANATANTCPTGYVPYQYLCVTEAIYQLRKYRQEYCLVLKPDFNVLTTLEDGTERAPMNERQKRMDEMRKKNGRLLEGEILPATERFYRHLSLDTITMWDKVSTYSNAPLIFLIVTFLLGSLNIQLMSRCAKTCLYSVPCIGSIICAVLAFSPLVLKFHVCSTLTGWNSSQMSPDEIGRKKCLDLGGTPQIESGSFMWPFLLPGVFILATTYYLRKTIDAVAHSMHISCIPLRKNVSILCVSMFCFFIFLVYVGLWVMFPLSIPHVYDWTCDLTPSLGGGGLNAPFPNGNVSLVQIVPGWMSVLMAVLFLGTNIFFRSFITVIISAGVGGWYFHGARNQPRYPALQGLKMALSTSADATVSATIIVLPVINVRCVVTGWMKKVRYLPFLPWAWVYYFSMALWTVGLRPFLRFTRFQIIAHTIHGVPVLSLPETSWDMLKKHLGGVAVQQTSVEKVAFAGGALYALGLGFISWVWMDFQSRIGYLSDFADGEADFKFIIFMVLCMIIFVKHYLFSILLISFFGNMMTEHLMGPSGPKFHGYIFGLFIGSLSNIVLVCFSRLMHVSFDTILYCYALDAEYSKSAPGTGEICEYIKNNIVTPMPEFVSVEENLIVELRRRK